MPETVITVTLAGVRLGCYHPALRARLDPDEAAERVYNFLHCPLLNANDGQSLWKTNIHSLAEDLAAPTMEASLWLKCFSRHPLLGRPDMNRF